MAEERRTQVFGSEENRCVANNEITDIGLFIEGNESLYKGFLNLLRWFKDDAAMNLVRGVPDRRIPAVRMGSASRSYIAYALAV